MRKVYRRLNAALWRPEAVNHLRPDEPPTPQLKKAETRRPMGLQTRLHLAEMSNDKTYHPVDTQSFGMRVDEYVRQQYPELTNDAIKSLVENGHIYRYRNNGKKRFTRLTDRLELDELLVVPTQAFWENQIAPPASMQRKEEKKRPPLSPQTKEEALSWVLFKNEDVVVINKPPGIAMGGGQSRSLDVNISDMLPVWKYTNQQLPIICNKLDMETSGIVVLARSPEAHRMLSRMFMKRVAPNNVYWAFCAGKPEANYGRIRMHCEVKKGKGGDTIIARPTPTKDTRVSIAEYVVNESVLEYGSFVSFYPLTSRAHQTRIMAAHALRAPIFGDARFGGEAAFPNAMRTFWDPEDKGIPLHLHHRKIQLPFKNKNGKFICVTAPVPKHMKETFKKLGWPVELDDPLVPG